MKLHVEADCPVVELVMPLRTQGNRLVYRDEVVATTYFRANVLAAIALGAFVGGLAVALLRRMRSAIVGGTLHQSDSSGERLGPEGSLGDKGRADVVIGVPSIARVFIWMLALAAICLPPGVRWFNPGFNNYSDESHFRQVKAHDIMQQRFTMENTSDAARLANAEQEIEHWEFQKRMERVELLIPLVLFVFFAIAILIRHKTGIAAFQILMATTTLATLWFALALWVFNRASSQTTILWSVGGVLAYLAMCTTLVGGFVLAPWADRARMRRELLKVAARRNALRALECRLFDAQPFEGDIAQVAYVFTVEAMSRDASNAEIQAILVERGLDQQMVATVVGNAREKRSKEIFSAGMENIAYGAIWFIGGIVVTAGTYLVAASAGGGAYVVTWGAVVYGAIRFFRGLIQLRGK